jgi:hypothetical protein
VPQLKKRKPVTARKSYPDIEHLKEINQNDDADHRAEPGVSMQRTWLIQRGRLTDKLKRIELKNNKLEEKRQKKDKQQSLGLSETLSFDSNSAQKDLISFSQPCSTS